MKKKILALTVILLALVVGYSVSRTDEPKPAPVPRATHSWGGYHWAKKVQTGNLIINVDTTRVGGKWARQTNAVMKQWLVVSSPIKLQLLTPRPNYKLSYYTVKAENKNYGPTGWLGLATVYIDQQGHIVRGLVQLNDYYYVTAPFAAQLKGSELPVYCQEVGHTFGLDHNRPGTFGGPNDNTCMNDIVFYPKPNIHDTEEFSLVYNHSDGYGTGGSGPPTMFPFGEQAGLQTITHATLVSDYIHQ
jgi:hypothetical protein